MSRDRPDHSPMLSSFKVGPDEFALFGCSLDLPQSLRDKLNEAEADVCQKLLAGLSAFEIAKSRDSSVHTVENQIHSVYQKLNLHSRRELLLKTLRASDDDSHECD